MKLVAILPLLMLCLACAPAKQPLTISAVGFSQINPKIPGGAGHRTALKLAELNARQQLHDHLNMYHLDGDQPLEQLYTVDPFVHAVCDDTIRSARITDRAIKEDGSVAVKVELNMDLLAAMLGASVTAPPQPRQQPAAPAK